MKSKFLTALLISLFCSAPLAADMYIVSTTDGPGFTDPSEAVMVLEKGILPTFAMLMELKKQKKIKYVGFPAGSRTLIMLVEADSHSEVDRMLRDLPAWGVFTWKVKPMQSLEDRDAMEKAIVKKLKNM
ncbi:MAG: hypothetical protein HKO58_03835 [Gammaproteobacteria bacterium]|nr:hypothetical protein [Gammaproteobacteria bacterium]